MVVALLKDFFFFQELDIFLHFSQYLDIWYLFKEHTNNLVFSRKKIS